MMEFSAIVQSQESVPAGSGRHGEERALTLEPRFLILTALMIAQLLGSAPGARANTLVPGLDESEVAKVIAKFKQKDPGMGKAFAQAYGYAVFPTVGKGGIGIGGVRGKGYVYQGGRLIGRSRLTQVTIGLQLGGQAYSEVVFFKTATALQNFTSGRLKLDAQASAVALTARASAGLAYRDGVAIVTMAKDGLMYEASAGEQKFSFEPLKG
jgi:lipid-binding SYLF domain-containing protein